MIAAPVPQTIAIPPGQTPPRALIDALVEASARSHGHLCSGQVIGVRMSILGLGLLGCGCPLGMPEIKNIVGFVEVERCLADAVAAATGLRFGRGSLKMINLGLLAVSFLDLTDGRAVRVVNREQSKELARDYAPAGLTKPSAVQEAAYRLMPDDVLFEASWVRIDLEPNERPGARPEKIPCQRCGVLVRSGQLRRVAGQNLCAVCAGQAYFSPAPGDDRS